MLLKEIVAKNLTGWSNEYAYVMELAHELMGFFPVIKSGTKKVVVSLDREVLKKIWQKLPRREVEISKILVIVNKKEKLLIPLNSLAEENANSDNFFLVLKEDVDTYLKKDDFFEWAPGLFSFKNEDEATFPEV